MCVCVCVCVYIKIEGAGGDLARRERFVILLPCGSLLRSMKPEPPPPGLPYHPIPPSRRRIPARERLAIIAKQPASAPHMLRIVPHTLPRRKQFPDHHPRWTSAWSSRWLPSQKPAVGLQGYLAHKTTPSPLGPP